MSCGEDDLALPGPVRDMIVAESSLLRSKRPRRTMEAHRKVGKRGFGQRGQGGAPPRGFARG
jgi:hypothetical protein